MWIRGRQIEIILNVPLEEFEEFKSHSLSVRTPSGRKTDLKQAPVRGLGTPNGGIVVFDKTSGEAMNIMPKSSAHVTLRCQDEWCTILQRTAKRNAVSFNTIRRFMDSKGVEPSTFRMRTERSPNWATSPYLSPQKPLGGAWYITPDCLRTAWAPNWATGPYQMTL